MIVIGLLALRLSVTAKASTAPAASSTRASLTDMPTGPWTLSDVEWFSLRPSSVQMAPALSGAFNGSMQHEPDKEVSWCDDVVRA